LACDGDDVRGITRQTDRRTEKTSDVALWEKIMFGFEQKVIEK